MQESACYAQPLVVVDTFSCTRDGWTTAVVCVFTSRTFVYGLIFFWPGPQAALSARLDRSLLFAFSICVELWHTEPTFTRAVAHKHTHAHAITISVRRAQSQVPLYGCARARAHSRSQMVDCIQFGCVHVSCVHGVWSILMLPSPAAFEITMCATVYPVQCRQHMCAFVCCWYTCGRRNNRVCAFLVSIYLGGARACAYVFVCVCVCANARARNFNCMHLITKHYRTHHRRCSEHSGVWAVISGGAYVTDSIPKYTLVFGGVCFTGLMLWCVFACAYVSLNSIIVHAFCVYAIVYDINDR